MSVSPNADYLLDTLRHVETPEGITLELNLAGPVARSLAWAVDALIRYGILGACLLTLGTLGATGWGITLIAFFLLEWLYPVLFEVYSDGATPGKKMLGLRVVYDDGRPVDFGASITRNLLRAADFLPMLYGFGLICMLLNQDAKRLGDLAAGTVVIYRPPPSSDAAVTSPTGSATLPVRVRLSPAEQRLLLNFAERSADLNPERCAELAALLPPLGDTKTSHPETLLAQARWLHGNDPAHEHDRQTQPLPNPPGTGPPAA